MRRLSCVLARVVPEPSSMLLAGIGAAAAMMVTRRLRRRARGRRPQEVPQEVQRCE